jgi:hypothetical protein
MENGSGLILSVACTGESWKRTEENGAVGDEVGRWNGVGKDVGRASSVGIVACSNVRSLATRALIAMIFQQLTVGSGTARCAAAVR